MRSQADPSEFPFERDAAPTGLELLGRGAYVPSFSPPIPHLTLDATVDLEPISSSRLRRKSGAHRLEIGPLLLTYLFSEGTYVSTYDVSPHYGPPLRHLHRLPSSTAGFRSTFDRLPYGCLLFMYRLDLTVGKPGGKPLRLTASVKIARARPDRFWPAYPFLCVCV